MIKLKEINKSEDSGSKARHYLDGLLKIPFGQYKNEEVLSTISECIKILNSSIQYINDRNDNILISKDKYTIIDVGNKMEDIQIF